MSVKALGYVVIETANRGEWERFLTRVAGAMKGKSPRADVDLYVVDGRSFRFWIQQGTSECLRAAAYAVSGAEAWNNLMKAISAAGQAVDVGSAHDAAERGVAAFFRTTDPAGNRLEFYHGDTHHTTAFKSPVGMSGFVTGEMGLGHAVFAAPKFAATHAFYRDVIGFGDTDLPSFFLMGPDGPEMRFAFMHGSSGRHHSLALGEMPVPPSGCVHLMLEMLSLNDVGKAYDRMRAEGFTQSASLGRHVNDEMIGFYVQTPGGFDLEIGCEGLVIDPSTWKPTRHERISEWGHVWAWQEAMRQAGQ
ncbi:MAG: glyoxalase [Alphaproteobacteria bacterium]|nr:glyoxalase [Alphaproteobacteria bacterium]